MKKHSDYITHIKNKEDLVYLKTKHFPVNMRLFQSSPEYKAIILQQCEYIRKLCLQTVDGYKKPHGMSSANAGLSFNIIGITRNRNKSNEYCEIMINPEIVWMSSKMETSKSNCGSITLDEPINVKRCTEIEVHYYNERGMHIKEICNRESQSFTIQHEVEHNLGILITDK